MKQYLCYLPVPTTELRSAARLDAKDPFFLESELKVVGGKAPSTQLTYACQAVHQLIGNKCQT